MPDGMERNTGSICGSVYQGTGSGHQAIKEIGMTGIPIVNVKMLVPVEYPLFDWLTNQLLLKFMILFLPLD